MKQPGGGGGSVEIGINSHPGENFTKIRHHLKIPEGAAAPLPTLQAKPMAIGLVLLTETRTHTTRKHH